MKSERICLVWRGRLKPCPRPKVGRGHGVYYPSGYYRHLKELRAWFNEATAGVVFPEGCLFRVSCTVYKVDELDSRRFGDADNLLKTVLDMLPFDDARVASVLLKKERCASRSEERLVIRLGWWNFSGVKSVE